MNRLNFKQALLPALCCIFLGACSQPSEHVRTATPPISSSTRAVLPAQIQSQAVGKHMYEVVQAANGKVYVASIGEPRDGLPGSLYVLDGQTLQIDDVIQTPRKPFALALNHQTGILYVGHTYDSYISAVDIASGKLIGEVALHTLNSKGEKNIHIRQIAVDERTNTIYVGGIDELGIVWAVDGKTLQVKKSMRVPGSTGLLINPSLGELYTSGTSTWSAIDLATGVVKATHRIDDKHRRYLINLTLDGSGQRLLAVDSKYNGELLQFNIATGQLLKSIEIGEGALGIRYNPVRNEIYTTSRDAAVVQIIDADSLAIKRSIPLEGTPNSLTVSNDGQVLYVVLMQPEEGKPGWRKDGKDSVVRIDLNQLP